MTFLADWVRLPIRDLEEDDEGDDDEDVEDASSSSLLLRVASTGNVGLRAFPARLALK